MSEILAEATFPSVIHNNEVCEEIVKWGNKNGFPLQKAKLYNKMDGYVGFSPDNYFIKATRLPPVPFLRLFLQFYYLPYFGICLLKVRLSTDIIISPSMTSPVSGLKSSSLSSSRKEKSPAFS